jgi:hypothetical protein
MRKLLYLTSALMVIALALQYPVTTYGATTYHLVCSNFSTDTASSCTGNTFTFTLGNQYAYDGTPVDPIGVGTWYVSMTVTRTGGTAGTICTFPNCSSGSYTYTTTSLVDYPISVTTGTNGFYIDNANANWAGTVTNICVSNVSGACEGGGSPTSVGTIIFFN